ncbi:hypothetical protein CRENBAI_015752 [Crenichthys baileyi]|uniref:Uncharacterized protein n=1 Tax=Crenichthys baileyi TaxID=28760 RepID=A0AAV9S722_9TELE
MTEEQRHVDQAGERLIGFRAGEELFRCYSHFLSSFLEVRGPTGSIPGSCSCSGGARDRAAFTPGFCGLGGAQGRVASISWTLTAPSRIRRAPSQIYRVLPLTAGVGTQRLVGSMVGFVAGTSGFIGDLQIFGSLVAGLRSSGGPHGHRRPPELCLHGTTSESPT